MGNWFITVPEATTNYVLNPSAEMTGNFAAHNSATVTQDTTYARFGAYAYKVVLGATNRGVNLTLSALANAIHNVTFYAQGTVTGTLQASADSGSNYNACAVVGGATGGWVRYNVQIAAAQCNGSTALIIRDTANDGTLYIDGVQVEQKTGYYTTYTDGDQAGCYWSGLRHGSTSTRDAQYRLAGRERDLLTDYSVKVRQMEGAGVPPVVNNTLSIALQPGAFFQSTKIMPRAVTLTLTTYGSSLANLHTMRRQLWDIIKPDAVQGSQAFLLSYAGASTTRKVYGQFRYASGMELLTVAGGGAWVEGGASTPIIALAVDPFWYEDNQETAALDFQDSISNANYIVGRNSSGTWGALGTGMNALVRSIRYGPDGAFHIGGDFTTASGGTAQYYTKWTGSAFTGGSTGFTSSIYDIDFSPAGAPYVVGATDHALLWYSGGTWNAVDTSVPFTRDPNGTLYAVKFDSAGRLWIEGNFTAVAGVVTKYLAYSSDGSGVDGTWVNPTSGMTSVPNPAFALGADSYLYIGSDRLTRLTTTGLTDLGTATGGSAAVYALLAVPSGDIYVGGNFTAIGGVSASNLAVWNGQTFRAVGSGTNGDVRKLFLRGDGNIYVAGSFTTAGGMTVPQGLAGWNGSTFFPPDILLPGSPTVYAIASGAGSSILYGFSASGAATVPGNTTVTPTATTAVYPTFTLIGPSSASCVLQWLENQSTGERLYFNLTVQSGETITIDLRPGQKVVTSNWRGTITDQPLANSDLSSWHLLPGANTVAAFITGTTTGVSLLAHWTPAHWSVDGTAP